MTSPARHLVSAHGSNERRSELNLRRFGCFTNDVIFVDGLWGTGKSLITPIISGMDGIEKQRFDHVFEWLSIAHHLGRIEQDAIVTLLQTYADLDQYNNLVGREVNLRWADDSGPGNNPNWLRYIRRMFGPDGDSIVEQIEAQNLALMVTSHMILLVADPMFDAFGSRLKLVEIVRHPLYVVTHWLTFLTRFGAKRIFNLSLDCGGQKVPWFTNGWAEEYVRLSTPDRALASIVRLYRALFAAIDRRTQRGDALHVVSFEQVALDTDTFLEGLASFLGRPHHPRLRRILRNEKLPRRHLLEGRGKTQYGFRPAVFKSERDSYSDLLATVTRDSSGPYLEQFGDVITEYNRRWPSILNQFHLSSS